MKPKIVVSTVTSIQIRYEYDTGGGSNKRYLKPGPAAKEWATWKRVEWQDKHLRGCHWTTADRRKIEQIEDKYYRRALPIFKAMVAGNKK